MIPQNLSHRQLLPADVRLPGLRLQQEQASWPKVLEDPLEEPHQATVAPVQVDPLGHAKTHDDVVLWPLSQHQVIAVQDVIGLEEATRPGQVIESMLEFQLEPVLHQGSYWYCCHQMYFHELSVSGLSYKITTKLILRHFLIIFFKKKSIYQSNLGSIKMR